MAEELINRSLTFSPFLNNAVQLSFAVFPLMSGTKP